MARSPDMQMANFPIEKHYNLIARIARQEIDRHIRKRNALKNINAQRDDSNNRVFAETSLDREDAISSAVFESYRALCNYPNLRTTTEIGKLTRIVCRRRVQLFDSIPANRRSHFTAVEFEGEPFDEIVFDPWPEIEELIAFEQIAKRAEKDLVKLADLAHNVRQQGNGGNDRITGRKHTREWDRVQRQKFIAKARHALCRRFD